MPIYKKKQNGFVCVTIIAVLFLANCTTPTEQGVPVTMYKSTKCGCCGIWATYADQNGFDVTTVPLASTASIKDQNGIPQHLQSCHTSIIEGYVVEGHVPVEIINKLLEERPDIKGIALPGMPSGTPGMPGPKTEEWVVYALHHDGSITEYARI